MKHKKILTALNTINTSSCIAQAGSNGVSRNPKQNSFSLEKVKQPINCITYNTHRTTNPPTGQNFIARRATVITGLGMQEQQRQQPGTLHDPKKNKHAITQHRTTESPRSTTHIDVVRAVAPVPGLLPLLHQQGLPSQLGHRPHGRRLVVLPFPRPEQGVINLDANDDGNDGDKDNDDEGDETATLKTSRTAVTLGLEEGTGGTWRGGGPRVRRPDLWCESGRAGGGCPQRQVQNRDQRTTPQERKEAIEHG